MREKKASREVRKPRYFEVPLHKRLRKKLTAGEKLPVELSLKLSGLGVGLTGCVVSRNSLDLRSYSI